ncbi:MAG: hypothetical protein RSH52_04695, partial [Janthinobacterium sp.]
MTRSSVRKGWLAGGIGLGACALAGAAWVGAQQHAAPAAPPAATAPVVAPAPAPASTAKPGSPRTAGKGGTPPKAGENPSWNK